MQTKRSKRSRSLSRSQPSALDATIFWITNESKLMLQQVLEPEASKIGIGIAENKNRYYVVAKYNNVIE